MQFMLDEGQLALQDSLDTMLSKEMSTQRLLDVLDSDAGMDNGLWKTIAETGALGILVPEQYGGMGLGILDTAVVAEVFGRHAVPGPFLAHMLTILAIAEGGTDSQKEQWLPRLASGEAIGTIAWDEGSAAWQPVEWTLAVGNGRVSGVKHYVPNATSADIFVVGLAGGALGLVDVTVARPKAVALSCIDGTRRLEHVTFEEHLVEPLTPDVSRVRDLGLVLLAADAYGGASRVLSMAVDYVKEREQFGRIIGSFQAVKHQVANVAVDVEHSIGLYWFAAHAMDNRTDDSGRFAAMAKAHISDRFVQAGRNATELHGGIGYTWEYPLHIWLKRAIFDRTYLGSAQKHRERIAMLGGW